MKHEIGLSHSKGQELCPLCCGLCLFSRSSFKSQIEMCITRSQFLLSLVHLGLQYMETSTLVSTVSILIMFADSLCQAVLTQPLSLPLLTCSQNSDFSGEALLLCFQKITLRCPPNLMTFHAGSKATSQSLAPKCPQNIQGCFLFLEYTLGIITVLYVMLIW